MDLVALVAEAVEAGEQPLHAGERTGGLPLDLFAVEDGVHVQKPQPADLRQARGLHAIRVRDAAAQHLIAAADAEDGRAARGLLADGSLEPRLAEPAEVGDGALGAGQKDHVRRAELADGGDIAQRDVRIALKGRKISKIGDARQADHGQIQELAPRGSGKTLGEAVFLIDIHPRVGHDARHRHAAERLELP